MAVSARVSTESGQEMRIAEGTRLVFGRGPGVDLAVAAGRGLSRRAGIVTAMAAGAWITNISRTHALYVEGEDYRIRLPRLEDSGEPAGGWLLHTGTARGGSRAMLDEGVAPEGDGGGLGSHARRGAAARGDGDRTASRRDPGREPAGRRGHDPPALPRPHDQGIPGRVDLVPAVADRPERHHGAAADTGNRPGRARGDRRLPRARAVRDRRRVP